MQFSGDLFDPLAYLWPHRGCFLQTCVACLRIHGYAKLFSEYIYWSTQPLFSSYELSRGRRNVIPNGPTSYFVARPPGRRRYVRVDSSSTGRSRRTRGGAAVVRQSMVSFDKCDSWTLSVQLWHFKFKSSNNGPHRNQEWGDTSFFRRRPMNGWNARL